MKKTISTFSNNRGAGFTLIETLVAIFILMLTIGALLTLTAGGYFSIRYAKNDIVATNLLQESLEYIRNTRDTAAQQSLTASNWYLGFWSCDFNNNPNGCTINPYARTPENSVEACSASGCKALNYYSDKGFYGYYADDFNSSVPGTPTSFVRTISMKKTTDTDPQLIVTATITWMNGTNPKTVKQSMVLTKWNLQ